MAIVKNKLNKEKLILHCQHSIGRGRDSTSFFNQKDVSRKHAIICWKNNYWQLTDTSSNGTKVNSKYAHHTTKKLEVNDLIRFSNNEEAAWEIVNLDPPSSFFRAIDNNSDFIVLNKGKLLTKGNNSKWTFFQNNVQKWVMDNEEESTILINKEKYLIDGVLYEFIENENLSETILNTDITDKACFQLVISVDEESITSKITINDLELDLGNRVFNHLLLHLVRAKQQDLEFGYEDKLSGWVYLDDLNHSLSKELLRDVDVFYINTLIHRLRKILINLPPYGGLFAHIIERKKGKLRFGLSNFEIEKEQCLA